MLVHKLKRYILKKLIRFKKEKKKTTTKNTYKIYFSILRGHSRY